MNSRKRPFNTADDDDDGDGSEGAKCNITPTDLVNLKRPLIEEPVPPPFEQPACSSQQYFMETASTILKLKKLDKQVLKMIAKGHHTLSIVEEPEFRKLIKNVSRFRGYKLQTRRSLTNELLPNVCREILENVKSKIRSSLAVCLTTDSWTSATNVCYVTVTAHYIDSESCELKSYMIGCSEIKDGQHSDDGLYNFFKNIMLEFEIWNKVSAIVSDDKVVNIAAVVRQGPWSGITCFAQTLQRILQIAFSEILNIVEKTRKILEYLQQSPPGLEMLKEIEREIDWNIIQLKPELEKHCCDTYLMLESILNLKNILLAKIASSLHSHLLLSLEEWDLLTEIVHILKPFYEVIQEICAENNVMLSKASVLSHLLQSFVSKCYSRHNKVTAVITKIKNEMNLSFADYENNYLYAESILLDPRFKRNGFRSNSAYEAAVEKLRGRINRIRLNDDNQIRTSSAAAEQGNSIWHDFDQDAYKSYRAEDNTAAAKLEFDNYLEEEYLGRKNDPLIWWNKRKNIYPRLYQYALKRLCNLATSVPSEQIFTSSAQSLRDRRMHLQPEEVSNLVFLHHNM